MKKYMPLEGLRWSRDSGSTLCDTPQNGRSRTGWGGRLNCLTLRKIILLKTVKGFCCLMQEIKNGIDRTHLNC